MAQFRAILTGLSLKPEEADRFWDLYLGDLSLDGAVVLDPFVGGGTSLVEAERAAVPVGLMNGVHLVLLPAEHEIDITLRPYGLQKLHQLGNGDA